MSERRITDLKAIQDARLAQIDGDIAAFANGVNQTAAALRAKVIDLISAGDWTEATVSKAKALTDLQREIQGQLNKMDYEGKIQDFIGQYDQAQQSALDALDAIDQAPANLGDLNISTKALTTLKNMDYQFLKGLGQQTVAAVSSAVIQNTLAGIPRAKILDSITATLEGKFRSYAITYADTALVSYDRYASMQIWSAAGMNQFLFRGPKDIKNRKFCEQHAGKVFTLAEIKKMDNGMKAPLSDVLRFGGGWNCRHIWTPVPGTSNAEGAKAMNLGGPLPATADAEPADLYRKPPASSSVSTPKTRPVEGIRQHFENLAAAKLAAAQAEAEAKAAADALAAQIAAAEAAEAQAAAEKAAADAAAKEKQQLYVKTWKQAKSIAKKAGPHIADRELVLQKQAQLFEDAGLKKPGWISKAETALDQAKIYKAAKQEANLKAALDEWMNWAADQGKAAAAKAAADAQAEADALAAAEAEKKAAQQLYVKTWKQAKAITKKLAADASIEAQEAALGAQAKLFEDAGLKMPGWLKKSYAALDVAKQAAADAAAAEAAAAAAQQLADEAAKKAAAKVQPIAPPEPPPIPASGPNGLPGQIVGKSGNVYTWNEAEQKYTGPGGWMKAEDAAKSLQKGNSKPLQPEKSSSSESAATPAAAAPPPGLPAILEAKSGTIWTWKPATGEYIAPDSGATLTPQQIKAAFDAGNLQALSPVQPPAAAPAPAPAPAAPPAPAPKPTPEDTSAFGQHFTKQAGPHNLGGAHAKAIYLDEQGDKWLFKPYGGYEKFVAYADEAAFKVGRLIRPETVEVRAVTMPDGQFGSIQKMAKDLAAKPDFTGRGNQPYDVNLFTPAEIEALQKEQVIDWLISNHDAHAAQFLRTKNGDVIGIDKSQAFKFLGKDKLSTTYHPNTVEAAPIYNFLFDGIKAGQVNFDPLKTLPAIKAAEAISDAEMVQFVKPYAESLFAGDAAKQKAFYDKVLARKNGIRKDFEQFYSDVLGKPFVFEPKVKKAKTTGQAGPAAAEETAAPPAPHIAPGYQNLSPQHVEAVRQAPTYKAQGKSLSIDKSDIEDQNVLVWQEKMPDGSDRTVLRFKIRPEAQPKILAATKMEAPKVDPNRRSSYSYSAPTPAYEDKLATMQKLVPIEKGHNAAIGKAYNYYIDAAGNEVKLVSKQIFNQLIQDQPVHSWTYGFGGEIPADQIELLKKQAADYKALVEARKPKPAAAAPEPEKPAGKPSAAFKATEEKDITVTERKIHPGGAVTVNADAVPLNQILQGIELADAKQIHVKWAEDNLSARFMPFVEGQAQDGNAYALQGTVEVHVPGAIDPAAVDKALGKLADLGINTRAASPVDQEIMYLNKTAYAAKVDKEPEWMKLQRDTANAPEETKLEKMRDFWNRRLGVRDVTKLPNYKPEGEYQGAWKDGQADAGNRVYNRFDITPHEWAREMKDYRLYHDTEYGGPSVDEFLERALPAARGLVSTVEKLRTGILNRTATRSGASASADLGTGGATYAFTRIKNVTRFNEQGLYFKVDRLLRADAISYSGDNFGRTHSSNPENRGSSIREFQSNSGRGGNETIFKGELSLLNDIDYIVTRDPQQKKRVLDLFKQNGITKMSDGRKITDIVK